MNGPNMGSRNFVFKRSDKDLADRDGFQYCFPQVFFCSFEGCSKPVRENSQRSYLS